MSTHWIIVIRRHILQVCATIHLTNVQIIIFYAELIKQLGEQYSLPLKTSFNSTRGFFIQMYNGGKNSVSTDQLPSVFLKVAKSRSTVTCTTKDVVNKFVFLFLVWFFIYIIIFYNTFTSEVELKLFWGLTFKKLSLMLLQTSLLLCWWWFCTTAQTPLAAQGWPGGKQHLVNKSITLPLWPQRQIACSWIHSNFEQYCSTMSHSSNTAQCCNRETASGVPWAKRQSGKLQASMKAA